MRLMLLFSIFLILCAQKEKPVIILENACKEYTKIRKVDKSFKRIEERLKKSGYKIILKEGNEKFKIFTEIYGNRVPKDSIDKIVGPYIFKKEDLKDTIVIKIGIQSININTDAIMRKVVVLSGSPKIKPGARVTWSLVNYFGLASYGPFEADEDTFFFTKIYHGKKDKNLAERIKNFLKRGITTEVPGLKDIIIITGKDMIPERITDYGILIKKSQFKLYLLKGYDTLKVYPIAIGKNPGDKKKVGDWRTPEGCFYVIQIQDSREWVHDFPDDTLGPIKGAYGPYFIRLYTGPDATYSHKSWSGIGIHGTHDPSSIGKRASEGCIRLKNQDLLELINYVKKGMPVWIEK